MNTRLTKRRTLKECVNLWNWLAEFPNKEKCNYPILRITAYNHACPCCEYVKRKFEQDTRAGMECNNFFVGQNNKRKNCPLNGLWPNGCEANSSPYFKWSHSGSRDKQKYAKVIAKFARKMYKRELAKDNH